MPIKILVIILHIQLHTVKYSYLFLLFQQFLSTVVFKEIPIFSIFYDILDLRSIFMPNILNCVLALFFW